jgi:hypothetical protein
VSKGGRNGGGEGKEREGDGKDLRGSIWNEEVEGGRE